MIMICNKKINVLAVLLAIIFMAGCSAGGNGNEADGGAANLMVSENQTAIQPEEGSHVLPENIEHAASSDYAPAETLSENETQEEDDGTYYTMEEVKALGIPEDMLAYWLVLNSRMPFVSYDEGQEFYWDEYLWKDGYPDGHPKEAQFRIVDLNDDGRNEIVIYPSNANTMIFHYEDDAVYAYNVSLWETYGIFLNGVCRGASGYYARYSRFTELNKDGYTMETIARAEYSIHGDHDYYEVGNISVSKEEYEEFVQTVEGVGEAEDIDYTEELLDEYLLAGLSEDELYMVKHAAAEPITDTAEYPMEPEMMQAYYEVLTGGKEFISITDDGKEFYLNSYHQVFEGLEKYYQISYFSIVDMDQDGIYEVVLAGSPHFTQILHYEDGNIYGYRFHFDEMGAITNGGIFSIGTLYYWMSMDDAKYGVIRSFEKDGCDIEEIDYNGNINDDRIQYYYFSEELIEQYFR